MPADGTALPVCARRPRHVPLQGRLERTLHEPRSIATCPRCRGRMRFRHLEASDDQTKSADVGFSRYRGQRPRRPGSCAV